MILELQIELKELKPSVWRTIHIHRHATFQNLHNIIQLMFDWWDTYPYEFRLLDDGLLIISKRMKNQMQQSHKKNHYIYADETKLEDYFKMVGDCIEYEYGLTNGWRLEVTLQKVLQPMTKNHLYPLCVDAGNELLNKIGSKRESIQFPFGKQRALQHHNLVNRLNEKIADNMLQFSTIDRKTYSKDCWIHLKQATEKYYDDKPWEDLTNQQIFAIYDEQFDEYLFCSVLGNDNGLYGLSVYVGFNGLLSLHTSLTKNLSIEQLFQLHANLLLQFEKNIPKEAKSENKSTPIFCNDEVNAQFTSYQPGYFPWKINEKEATMFAFAIEQTLYLHEKVKSGYVIPNYIEEGELLLLTQEKNGAKNVETYITFEQMIKQVLPLQLTISELELKQLKTVERATDLVVEFSLQYVNVPIQRLKDNRPFLPLSSVIVNQQTKQIIYHNIYNARLDYLNVQAEFLHMINLLGVLPTTILTDELTYHYLKPLLQKEAFPVEVQGELVVTHEINESVSQYLLTKAE